MAHDATPLHARSRNRPVFDTLFVALSLSRLPTLALMLQFGVLMLVPQSQEILFGLQAPLMEFRSNASMRGSADWINFILFLLAAFLLALSIWYCARLLCTLHQDRLMPRDVLDASQLPDSMRRAVTWVPRFLGTLSVGIAAGSLLRAGVAGDSTARWPMGLCLAMPLVLAVYGQLFIDRVARPRLAAGATLGLALAVPLLFLAHEGLESRMTQLGFFHVALIFVPVIWIWRSRRWIMWSALAAGTTVIYSILALSVAAGIPFTSFLPFALLCATAMLPTLFHLLVVKRRQLWARIHQWHPTWIVAPHPSGPARPRTPSEVRVALSIGTIVAVGMLCMLHGDRLWLRSSATVALLFLCTATFALTTAALTFRFLVSWRPGLVWAPVLLIACSVAITGESIGDERLDSRAPAAMSPAPQARPSEVVDPGRRVVVNAHGGGLRAAYFTAHALAALDDLSCGRFGDRLSTASGVSGGSLGLATYLLARQHLVTQGDAQDHKGWGACSKDQVPTRPLGQVIDQLLLGDHLSGVVGTMLTFDLLPGSARRGQTLLDSWQRPYVDQLESSVSLSSPLSELTGGRPRVNAYFNATDARTGEGIAFSNADPKTSSLPIGLAVLHSARFPVVSPAGRWKAADGPERLVVDGGYADNSGAAQLRRAVADETFGLWLNIDGNPAADECAPASVPEDRWQNWTGMDALFASRRQRSTEAEGLMQARADAVGAKASRLTLNTASIFALLKMAEDRCAAARQLRTAPLGWYMSGSTAWDLRLAAESAASGLCKTLPDLCERQPRANGTP